MQKISIALAFILIFGCVSAIDFTQAGWSVQPKLVISNGTNDTSFLNSQNLLISSSANSSISLLNIRDPQDSSFNQRTFNLKDFGASGSDTILTLADMKSEKEGVFIGDYAVGAQVVGAQPQQVELIVTPLNGGASAKYNLTKNEDNGTVFNIVDVFVHHNRYYVVYGNSGAQYNISGADSNGANINTVVLTNNASSTSGAKSKIECVGLSGQESAYCLFVYHNDTNQYLFETTVGLKGSSNKAPDAKIFDVNATAVPDSFLAYNAGKQYGGIISVGTNWFFKSNKNATIQLLGSSIANLTQIKFPEAFFAFKDDYVLFWSTLNLTTQNANYYESQHIDVNGNVTLTGLANNVKSLIFTQYKDGSLYASAANASDLYLGQVWGETGMSASVLQSAFAIVLAAIPALFLF